MVVESRELKNGDDIYMRRENHLPPLPRRIVGRSNDEIGMTKRSRKFVCGFVEQER